MSSNSLIAAFIKFFNILGHHVQQQQQLFSGVRIAEFLLTIRDVELPYCEIIKDKEIRGALLNNMRIIEQAIQKYHRDVLGNSGYQVQFNVYEIYTDYNTEQLVKLLKDCFMLATKASNSSYFIHKILQLHENEQVLFAQLIRQDKSYAISPIREHNTAEQLETSTSNTSPTNRPKHKQSVNEQKKYEQNQALDLIDKLYECELQNEKLMNEQKKSSLEVTTLREQISELCTQINALKEHNENLRKDLFENQQEVTKLRNSKIDKDRQDFKYRETRKELETAVVTFREEVEMMKIQNQVARCRYENTILELERQLSREQDNSMRLREQIQFYQTELQKIIQKYQQYHQQIKQTTKLVKKLEQQNKTLHQNQTTLKFEISYKNQQISQLKQLLASVNSNSRRQSEYIDKDEYDYDIRSSMTNSKMLTSQFYNYNGISGSTPNLRASPIAVDADQLRALKNELKELQKQYDKCKVYKSKVRELEYQKNKLTKILREYETSRGEQNEIMTGCLYELQLKLAHNKVSFSRSTLGEDISNELR